ncbi:MAG: enoyl-CoA hydratase-related protein [Polaromonas sp.]|uniref:enoyl-CoA hydratase/isomerase family protein n=1 Tax=Polaromonas sp. TaxID=1869339 RepID=UPI0027331134|nr:enoyl-CoA hydratase/isomerase family protein [Polaromonas sp.]MDP3796775.1 enoyl-CoA hydratase-related protein [Polaromonas sp.]
MLLETGRRGQHVVLTLNRPEKLNALSYELIDDLMDRLDALERDDTVRCLVLTGRGNRAFSAGADIAGFAPDVAASPETAARRFVTRGQAMTRRIENYPKPIIAAVNGMAFGGGCETMEACSLAIAAEHATFAKPKSLFPIYRGSHKWIFGMGCKAQNPSQGLCLG